MQQLQFLEDVMLLTSSHVTAALLATKDKETVTLLISLIHPELNSIIMYTLPFVSLKKGKGSSSSQLPKN